MRWLKHLEVLLYPLALRHAPACRDVIGEREGGERRTKRNEESEVYRGRVWEGEYFLGAQVLLQELPPRLFRPELRVSVSSVKRDLLQVQKSPHSQVKET